MGEAMSKDPRMARLEEMVEQRPDAPFPRYALALEYREAGMTEAAVQSFESLLRNHPDYVAAYLQFAMLLQDLGEEERIAEVVRLGIEEASRQGDTKAVGELSVLLDE